MSPYLTPAVAPADVELPDTFVKKQSSGIFLSCLNEYFHNSGGLGTNQSTSGAQAANTATGGRMSFDKLLPSARSADHKRTLSVDAAVDPHGVAPSESPGNLQ